MATVEERVAALEVELAATQATIGTMNAMLAAVQGAGTHSGPPMTHVEPLDAMAVETRNESSDYGGWHTSTVRAFVHEAHARYSCAMPVYIAAWATDHPQANQGALTAMDTALTVRGYAPGVGWQAAVQVENYHLVSGTSVALDIEMARTSAKGTNIALNIHNDPDRSPAGDADVAINIQNPIGAGFKRVINMESAGVLLAALGLNVVTVEADGSVVIGTKRASITVRPDGNIGLDCSHLWFNGRMQF